MKLPAANKLLKQIKVQPEIFWLKRGERRVLELFKNMADNVPAYKDFLKKHRIKSSSVKTLNDFQKVPFISKDNYLRHYPLPKLCWKGRFKSEDWVISTTSGSTGQPFYFPRKIDQDLQYALAAEMYLLDNWKINKVSTLYIDAFPMGAWIGGLFTYEAIRTVARRGKYPLSIITTGIHKEETIRAVEKLGHHFDQVIIGSYGPFLKDILDDGAKQGVRWKDYNLKFVFSAEGFTEEFRDYVKKIGGLKNIYMDTLNHYGTVDMGTMSHETPIAIWLRRQLIKSKHLYNQVFGHHIKIPTLTQYLPELFYFEEVKGGLYCSSYSGLPLVRYNLQDHGGVISFNKMTEIFGSANEDLKKNLKKDGLEKNIWNLPFVYVYERDDFSVSFYAFQIYPETIRRALLKIYFNKSITGKFSMAVLYDNKQNQYIQIHIELKKGIVPSTELKEKISQKVVDQLLKESSEYRETHSKYPARCVPKIELHPYEEEKYFRPGGKQKWVLK